MSTSTIICRVLGSVLMVLGSALLALDPAAGQQLPLAAVSIGFFLARTEIDIEAVLRPSNPSVTVNGPDGVPRPARCTCERRGTAMHCPAHRPRNRSNPSDPLDAAARAYMSADPLDPTATLGFLLKAEALSERERSAISPSKPFDPWDQGVATDLASRGLLSSAAALSGPSGCPDCDIVVDVGGRIVQRITSSICRH